MRVRLADAAQVKVLKRDIIAQGGWSGDRGPVLRIGLDVQVWLEPNGCGNSGRCDMDLDKKQDLACGYGSAFMCALISTCLANLIVGCLD